jgi:hypothetical protein
MAGAINRSWKYAGVCFVALMFTSELPNIFPASNQFMTSVCYLRTKQDGITVKYVHRDPEKLYLVDISTGFMFVWLESHKYLCPHPTQGRHLNSVRRLSLIRHWDEMRRRNRRRSLHHRRRWYGDAVAASSGTALSDDWAVAEQSTRSFMHCVHIDNQFPLSL